MLSTYKMLTLNWDEFSLKTEHNLFNIISLVTIKYEGVACPSTPVGVSR